MEPLPGYTDELHIFTDNAGHFVLNTNFPLKEDSVPLAIEIE